jgi:serine/threonine-protein kinase
VANPVYSGTGHLLYGRQGEGNDGIWAAPFSLSTREITGEPFLVVPDAASPSISTDGTLVYTQSAGSMTELVWIDRDGRMTGTIGEPQQGMIRPRIAPDGRSVVVSAMQQGQRSLWLHDFARGTKSQLTFTDGSAFGTAWPAEGEILFNVAPSGATGRVSTMAEAAVYRMQADGSARPVKLLDGAMESVSRDGRYLFYSRQGEGTGTDLWYRTLGDAEPRDVAFLQSPHEEMEAQLSPDGRWLAYISDASGRREIYLTRFPSGEGSWLVPLGSHATKFRWDSRGDRIYVRTDLGVHEVMFEAQPSVSLGTPRRLVIETPSLVLWRGFDVTDDGERFVAVRMARGDGQDTAPPKIVVVQNWFEEFSQ